MGNNSKTRLPAGQAVLRALLYSDVFDFPLTLQEVAMYSQTDHPISEKEIQRLLGKLKKQIDSRHGYFFLQGRESIVSEREGRLHIQSAKMQVAREIAVSLAKIPTVLYLGVSGAVAAGNAKADDDIDFFVITANRTLWMTRLLLLLTLTWKGIRRKRCVLAAPDMVCLNMLTEEQEMQFREARQDLYTARECVQLVTLFSRNSTYEHFTLQNDWIGKFLCNGYDLMKRESQRVTRRERADKWSTFIGSRLLRVSILEYLASYLQRLYIGRHRTRETVERHFLAFHPRDYREIVLKKFEDKIKATGF